MANEQQKWFNISNHCGKVNQSYHETYLDTQEYSFYKNEINCWQECGKINAEYENYRVVTYKVKNKIITCSNNSIPKHIHK